MTEKQQAIFFGAALDQEWASHVSGVLELQGGVKPLGALLERLHPDRALRDIKEEDRPIVAMLASLAARQIVQMVCARILEIEEDQR
jgi:hypothetical protein